MKLLPASGKAGPFLRLWSYLTQQASQDEAGSC